MDTLQTAPSLTGPVTQTERIASIDVLRGFAVLGILVMNIQSFTMIGAAYLNPTVLGDPTPTDYWVWLFEHVLTDRKFMSIFSMLFGAGIVLMASRSEATTGRSASVHYRRMGLLWLFGLLHAHLLWYGDILFSYAMCGFLVFLFRRRQPKTLLLIGLAVTAVASGLSIFFGWSMQFWPEQAVQSVKTFWVPSAESVQTEVAAYRGGWVGQLEHRVPTALFFQTQLFLIETIWRAGGLMLVGMGLFKLGVFSATRSSRFYAALIAAGVFVGVPVILYGVSRNQAADWDMHYSFFLGSQFNYWGSILVSLGWVGLVMLACKHGVAATATRTLAAVGQMALTNYLLQTAICTTVFYGHGFGLFGRLDRLAQFGVVVAVWVVMLLISPLWLRHFRFGPAEWFWRSLTYMKPQPMRRN